MALSQPVGEPDHYCRLEVSSRIEKQFGNNLLVVEKAGSRYDYRRFAAGDCVFENIIASEENLQVAILPVAPVHVPTKYGSNMMLKFANPLVIQSHSSIEGYFKMPHEIGVMSFDNGNPHTIDTISLGLSKYGLYGNPENGQICRSYQTKLFSDFPEAKLHQEAIGKIRIRNETSVTHNVSKIVFPADDVDFYFDKNRVFFKDVEATIKEISKKVVLETNVVDSQWGYASTNLGRKPDTSYTMEWGF